MYKEYLPCHILAPYVDKYWEFKGQTEQGMQIKLSTDGCTDFMFILENTVNHGIIMQPYHSYFVGPMDICSALITLSGTINTFGVRFRPCGLSRFMKISLSELGVRTCHRLPHLSYALSISFQRIIQNNGYLPKPVRLPSCLAASSRR